MLQYFNSMGASIVIGNVCEIQNQELLQGGHDEEIHVLAVSSSGKLLASSQMFPSKRRGGTFTVLLWDLTNRQILYELTTNLFQRPVIRLAFSLDEHFLIATTEDSKMILWDMRVCTVILFLYMFDIYIYIYIYIYVTVY
jgi:WD40 repeat protein